MELVIYLKNEQDLRVLEPLLRRMKLRFEKKNVRVASTKPLHKTAGEKKLEAARALLLQMHREGVDASYYGDPSEWQRETRTEIRTMSPILLASRGCELLTLFPLPSSQRETFTKLLKV
ncbi:MAG: hypothetical protein ACKVUS_11425 [Saprospiraceae bacterium]